jgi:hypothetical protein
MKAIVKTKKIGGSIMLRVPKEIVEAEGIEENQMVELDVKKTRISGFGILKGLKINKEHIKASDFD